MSRCVEQTESRPRVRHVEAIPVQADGSVRFVLRDPQRLTDVSLTVSEATLCVLSLLDGTRTVEEVSSAFRDRFGGVVDVGQIEQLVASLDEVHFLDGAGFERYYQGLLHDYRSQDVRPMHSAGELGLADDPGRVLDDILSAGGDETRVAGHVVGLVAPHLDYPRGRPCYAAAYSQLVGRAAPDRVVILGTNHFGRSASVTATVQSFETPLGVTHCDTRLIDSVESALGADLREFEMDHLYEHSIELQLMFCQHLWGAESFEMAAFLCPDPCGPTGTLPCDGRGPDLVEFAQALAKQIGNDGKDTLVIAGADLSHVGSAFGDAQPLNDAVLDQVRKRDALALDRLGVHDAHGFIASIADAQNPTRVCSAGCISAAMTALPESRIQVLDYHQAVDENRTTGVTCTAAVFVRDGD